ncbi:MAG: type II toxin-antitoxin system VapC family toxin [Chloroflexi bacterium]|nr:type II toxin-antitoxin system VapC family toxin [Chloroflexota bacterium]
MVADASLLVAALVDSGRDGRWAESRVASDTLAGPELALAEASNTLRRMELGGRITSGNALRAQRDLLRLPLELFPFGPFADRVWALRSTLTSYDAWYVALAEALDCPLLTLDRRLGRAPGPACEVITPPA